MLRAVVGAGGALRGLARALHAAQRDAHLRLAGGVREVFDRLPVAVAAREVHPPVDARGIPLQHLLDQADPLHEAGPVQVRTEAEAREHVRHRHLRGGLAVRLGQDHALDRLPLAAQALVERGAQPGHASPELAQALHERNHERAGEGVGQARQLPSLEFQRGQVAVGPKPVLARLHDALRDPTEALEEGELERAGPGPQLPQGQRAHGLVGGEEAGQAIGVEARVAVAEELPGHGLDAGETAVAFGNELGELPIVGGRQVVDDPRDFRLDQVEVIEQPFRGRREGPALVHVFGDDGVGDAQAPVDLAQPTEVAAAPSPSPLRGEAGGQCARQLLELLDVQELRGRLGGRLLAAAAAQAEG